MHNILTYIKSIDNGPLVVILEDSGLFDGLVAYYKFENNARDSSGMGNHGQIIGNPFKYESGKKWCFFTNTYSDYIEIPNSTSLNMRDAITVIAWINPVNYSGGGFDPIVTKPYYSHTYPYYQYQLGISGSNASSKSFGFNVSAEGTRYGVNSYPTIWTSGKWYFVVGTYDGKSLKLFVNGVETSSISVSGKIDDYGQNVWIGHGNNNGNPSIGWTPGNIDEVRIYNRALSQEEINTLYNQ
jgi:hypothetical protein